MPTQRLFCKDRKLDCSKEIASRASLSHMKNMGKQPTDNLALAEVISHS